MSRNDTRVCDAARPASAETPTQPSDDAEASPPRTPPGKRPAIVDVPCDPEMERYRSRLDAQLARRNTAQSQMPTQPSVPGERALPALSWVANVLREGPPPWLTIAPIVALLIVGGAVGYFHREPVAPVAVTSTSTPPAHDDSAQLKQALLLERDKTEQLSRELTVAWRELNAQVLALADKAAQESELGDLRQALKQTEELAGAYELLLSQERRRTQMLDEQLVARNEAASAGKGAQSQETVTLRQALKQAEERAAGQAQLLSAATADKAAQEQAFGSLRLAVKQAAEQAVVQEQALTQQRQRSLTLEEQLASDRAAREQELSTLRQRNRALEEQLASDRAAREQELSTLRQRNRALEEQLASDKVAREQELGALRQALKEAEERETGHQQHVAEERGRIGQLKTEVTTRPAVVMAADRPAKTTPANGKASDGASDGPTPVAASANLDLPRLMARARLLLVQGDIGAARIVLERAAEGGNAPALFALAETFDPAVLSAWGTLGTQGDVARAQDLYAKAFAGGVLEAKERMGASLGGRNNESAGRADR